MPVKHGTEWIIAYVLSPVLSQAPDNINLVVLLMVQMGWRDSPEFFCTALEIARDLVDNQFTEPVESLPQHLLEEMMLLPHWWAG